MGPFPSDRVTLVPPFYNCSCDIVGPVIIKVTDKRKTTSKAYGIVFMSCHPSSIY